MESKIDTTEPRRLYLQRAVKEPAMCPGCGIGLVREHRAYAVLTKTRSDTSTFMIGSDFGLLCPACPSLVIDRERVELMLSSIPEYKHLESYAVMGIVDRNAKLRGDVVVAMPLNDREELPVVVFEQDLPELTAADERAIAEAAARRERRRLKRLK